jgi:two-component system response regulator
MTALRILVADDNPDHRELLRLALRELGCSAEVTIAANGIEALDVLFEDGEAARTPRARLPALVSLDIKMPSIDGFEVLRRMKQHPLTRAIPVIMSSSCDEAQDCETARALGAERLVRKPNTYAELVAVIGELRAYWENRGGT